MSHSLLCPNKFDTAVGLAAFVTLDIFDRLARFPPALRLARGGLNRRVGSVAVSK